MATRRDGFFRRCAWRIEPTRPEPDHDARLRRRRRWLHRVRDARITFARTRRREAYKEREANEKIHHHQTGGRGIRRLAADSSLSAALDIRPTKDRASHRRDRPHVERS